MLKDASTPIEATISPGLREAHRTLIVQGEATVQGRAVTGRI